jgi:hypothetical protein
MSAQTPSGVRTRPKPRTRIPWPTTYGARSMLLWGVCGVAVGAIGTSACGSTSEGSPSDGGLEDGSDSQLQSGCQSSLASWCAVGLGREVCVESWSTVLAFAPACSGISDRVDEVSSSSCGGYDVLWRYYTDDSYALYYDENTGDLVAVSHEPPPPFPQQLQCVAGPSGFLLPACANFHQLCPAPDGGLDAGD